MKNISDVALIVAAGAVVGFGVWWLSRPAKTGKQINAVAGLRG